MAVLPLTNSSLVALVDDADLLKVIGKPWRLHSQGYNEKAVKLFGEFACLNEVQNA